MLHIVLIFFVYIKYSTQILPHKYRDIEKYEGFYETCSNQHDHCELWMRDGFCCYDQFKKYMEYYCRLSCEQCPGQSGVCREPPRVLPVTVFLCRTGVSKLKRRKPECHPKRMNKELYDEACAYECFSNYKLQQMNLKAAHMTEENEDDRIEIVWPENIVYIGPFKIEVDRNMYQYPEMCFNKELLRIGHYEIENPDQKHICCFFSDSFYEEEGMEIDCEFLSNDDWYG